MELELSLDSSANYLTSLYLCSPVCEVGVFYNTCRPEQVEELEYSVGYQGWCSRTVVWEWRPFREESFHAHRDIAHSFTENPLRLQFCDG